MRLLPLLLIAFALPLFAQSQKTDRGLENDPAARDLLDKVNSKYHSAAAMKVSFTLRIDTPEEEAPTESKGTVYVKKDKYKIDTEDMVIICDNVKRYIINVKDNEALISFFDPEEDEIESPSKLFDIYKDNYFSRTSGEVTVSNRKLTIITLIPADIKNTPYKMILLYIDKEKNEIAKAEIFAKDGIRYTYTIVSTEESPSMSDSEFTFDPARYPGIYVDDMTK